MEVQIIENLISDAQAETFAYNIYRDIAEYMKTNFEDFLWWNLEDISRNIVLTIDGIILIIRNRYSRCSYQEDDIL